MRRQKLCVNTTAMMARNSNASIKYIPNPHRTPCRQQENHLLEGQVYPLTGAKVQSVWVPNRRTLTKEITTTHNSSSR